MAHGSRFMAHGQGARPNPRGPSRIMPQARTHKFSSWTRHAPLEKSELWLARNAQMPTMMQLIRQKYDQLIEKHV